MRAHALCICVNTEAKYIIGASDNVACIVPKSLIFNYDCTRYYRVHDEPDTSERRERNRSLMAHPASAANAVAMPIALASKISILPCVGVP